jgi:16S rRNA processing protein RimM
MNKLLIGKILRPRGLKGELKVEILTNVLSVFSSVKKIFIDGKEYKVIKGSVQNGYAYINLSGVDKIETAEKFRNKEIYINETEIELNEDEVLSTDLIGFAVLNTAGEKIGTVQNIDNYGGGDFFEIVVTGGGTPTGQTGFPADSDLSANRKPPMYYIQIPNEDEFILETNMKNKTITVTDSALTSETVL